MTMTRRLWPTCGAASPMPGALYMVANIRGTSSRTAASSAG